MLTLVQKPHNVSNVMTQDFARIMNGVARNIQIRVSNNLFIAIKMLKMTLHFSKWTAKSCRFLG